MTQNGSCRLFAETLWISPYVFSTMVALREKGIPFEVSEVALADGEHLQPAYRDASLTGRVPSIEHGGFYLAESSAIAEYLDEVFPAPTYPRLLPEGARERARARQLMAWFRSDLGVLRDERPTVLMFYPYRPRPLTDAGKREVEKLIRVAEQTIPSRPGPLFGNWYLVDSELAFMLHRLILTGYELPPRVRAYAEAEWQRPAVRAFVDHRRPAKVPDSYWAFTPRQDPA